MAKSLYEILEVAETATQEEIKAAYRRLAMKWHPDRNPTNKQEAEEYFKKIAYAYKILSDPTEREKYDAEQRSQRESTSAESNAGKGQGYEGAAFSAESASQMFFDQIFDLAAELAARGFDGEQILRVLVGLECPEKIARAAAKHAAKSADNTPSSHSQKNGSTQSGYQANRDWHKVMPYYVAIINGNYPARKMEDNEYAEEMRIFNLQSKAYLSGVSLLLLGALFAAILPALLKDAGGYYVYAGLMAFFGVLTLLGTACWRLYTGSKRFNNERALRYYLFVFECFHNSISLPLRYRFHFWGWLSGGVLWLAYRRMHGKAIFVLLLWTLVTLLGQVFEFLGFAAFGGILLFVGVLLPFVIALSANGIYYRYAKKIVDSIVLEKFDDSIGRVSSVGGVSVWSAIAVSVLSILIGVPGLAFDEAIKNKRHAEVEAAQRAKFEADAREKERAMAKRRASEKAELDARAWAGKPSVDVSSNSNVTDDQQFQLIVMGLEFRHPELNPESPLYKHDIVDEVLKRAEYYQSLGYVRNDAIQLAVSSLERENIHFSNVSGKGR